MRGRVLSRSYSLHVVRAATSAFLRTSVTALLVAASTACHGLLDVSNPTIVRDADVANAAGANARRLNIVALTNANVPRGAIPIALFTDEWAYDDVFPLNDLDRRDSQAFESAQGSDEFVGLWDGIYWNTSIAIVAIHAYTPDSLQGDFLGQLFALRGYSVLQLAENVCPGFPLNDVTDDGQPLFGGPLTNDSAVAIAVSQLDSSIKYVKDSVRFATLARVTMGRALLDQRKYAEAAAVVTSVPTNAAYLTDGYYNDLFGYMSPGQWNQGADNFVMGEREGGNGMPFVSAHDPRVPSIVGGPSALTPAETLYKSNKYTAQTSPVVLASGIEARLIEAEAALHAGDGNWLTILNTLRATSVSPALPALVDPGTPEARVDLLYRERAFWLYTTGLRLGDLRRLIKNYGRNPETVFPTGPYPLGGMYGTATAIPFVLASEQLSNPHITSGCTTR